MSRSTYALSEVINLIGGGTPKRSETAFWNGDIPWLSIKDFNNDSRYVENAEEYITRLGLEKSSTKLLDPGMLIISARGTVGKLAQLKSQMAFNQSCYGLDANSEYLENDYLYYLLKIKIRELESIAHGSVFDTITRETFNNIFVRIPPKKEQLAIVEILGALDSKIELNQKMNETLEEIAKTLFKSWFIDFDPVRAKAEGRSTGLSKEISDLFPNSFEDSELGEIPTGWSVNNISKNFETTMGGTPSRKNKDFWEGEIEWINSGKLNDFPLNSCSEYISEAAVKNSSTKLAKRHSTLVGMVTEIGKDLITFSDRDFYINQSIVAIQPDDSIFPEFVYLYLKANSKRLYMEQSGGAQQHINKRIVNDFKILLPDQNSLEKFKPYFGDIFSKICLNSKQNIYLEEIRDLLLPKLISGELKIPDIQNLIGEAGI